MLKEDLALLHQLGLLLLEGPDLRLVAVDLTVVQHPLVSLLFELHDLDVLICFLVELKSLQFGFDFRQNLLQGSLLHLNLFQCLVHLLKLVIELDGSSDIFEHVQEALLPFGD